VSTGYTFKYGIVVNNDVNLMSEPQSTFMNRVALHTDTLATPDV